MKKLFSTIILLLLISSCALFKPTVKEETITQKIQPTENTEAQKAQAKQDMEDGIAFYQEGKDSLAMQAWQKAAKFLPDNAELHNYMGVALHRRGKIKEALREFEEALERDPAYYQAYNNAGYMWFLLKNYNRALAAFKQSLVYNPHFEPAIKNKKLVDDFISGHLSQKAFELTEKAAKKYDYAEQIKILRKVLKLDSTYAKAHNNIAVAYYYEDHLDSAYFHLKKAIALQKDYPEAINNLGYLYKLADNYEAAIKLFLKALTLKPRYIFALNNLGETYYLSGDQKNAKRVFQTVLEISPANPVAVRWMAILSSKFPEK